MIPMVDFAVTMRVSSGDAMLVGYFFDGAWSVGVGNKPLGVRPHSCLHGTGALTTLTPDD